MNILLIGARASGKTTIGRLLAERLAYEFVDLDDLTLASLALPSIKEVWAMYGESAWRAAEVSVLSTALMRNELIVALGGGTPMIAQARQLIEREKAVGSAYVVYLRCEAAQLVERLRASPGDRPSLTGHSPAHELPGVLQERAPTYEAMASLVFDCGERSPDEIAKYIAELVSARNPQS